MALPIVQLQAQSYPGSGREVPAENRREMTVVEGHPEPEVTPGYFVVVGGVKRSGVYISDEAKVSVNTLIQAAGGLKTESPVPVRILSGQRPPIQVFYNGDVDETVRPGEILVVTEASTTPGNSRAARIVPVVCLGLIDRPVVLPLMEEIANLPALVLNLGQRPEIVASAKKIDPAGRSSSENLSSGTVIIFDPNTIDHIQLKLADEFPPAVSLKAALSSGVATPESSTSVDSVVPGLPPGVTVREFSPSPASSESFTAPPRLPAPQASSAVPSPAFLADSNVTIEGPASAPIELPPAMSRLPSPAAEFATAEATTLDVPGASEAATEPTSFEIAAAPEPEPTPAEPLPTPVEPSPSIADAPGPTITATPVVAAPEHVPVVAENATSPVLTSPDGSGSDEESDRSDTLSASPHRSQSGLLPIAVFVGVLTVLCLGACLVWSRYDNMKYQEEQKTAPAKVAPGPTVSVQPAPVAAHSTLEDVVERALPVTSEPVELSVEIPLHGEAVGHKRLILHPAHDDVPKPKFISRKSGGRRTVSAAASVDRELREVVRSTVSHRPELAAPQVDQTRFDVIQPEASGSGSIEGALERALRTLAGEKQS
ncbi:MAG: hypothetical protein R3C18_01630 [Planctomycetaceae bacterium]